MNLDNINVITLAYLGDAVYELYIREKLINEGMVKSQVRILDELISDNRLFEDEIDVVKRGRNYKRNIHPKNTDIVTYKKSTGFEALIGYLYLNDKKRLNDILEFIEVK